MLRDDVIEKESDYHLQLAIQTRTREEPPKEGPVAQIEIIVGSTWIHPAVVLLCDNYVGSLQAAESKLAMMEANEEQLRQRRERRAAEKEEENRLIQIMLNKFKVWHVCITLVC